MFNQYPYLNLNDLNLDYILKAIKEMRYEVTNFVSINAIKYADPIQWNITSQYEKNTIVIDPVTGTAYISVAPVPAGVALTRPEYWTVVFDLGSFVTRAAQNFTSHWESDTTTTATFSTPAGAWLVWGDVLYKALVNITAGDTYIVNSNIEHFTIEDLYNAYLNTIANILAMVGDLVDLNTSDKTSIVNAINSVLNDLNGRIDGVVDNFNDTIGDLDNLVTSDKTSVVNSINSLAQEHYETTRRVYNIKAHGGDSTGATDCSSLITSAMNGGYNYIYFEKGTYLITSEIDLPNGVTIGGDNSYESIIKISGNGFVINTGGYCIFENLQFITDMSGANAITFNTSYNTVRDVIFNDTNNGYFQNCVLVGDTASSWFDLFENLRINDVNSPTLNGVGIHIKQGFNTLIDNLYCNQKYCAVQCDTVGGNHCEGMQITNSNIVTCNYGFKFDGGNMFTLTNVIIDQMEYRCIQANNVYNLWLDSCYLAPRLAASNLFVPAELLTCYNVKIDGLLASNLNQGSLISMVSCDGASIANCRFESCPLGIGLSDANNKNCTFHDIYCANVATALYLQGAGNNITYYNIYDGSVSLVDVNEQGGNPNFASVALSDNVATTWYDFTIPIKSIGSVPTFAFATIVDAEADYSIVYTRSGSTTTALKFRLKRNDGAAIGAISFKVIVAFYK